jgi:orotate phosphoribosyltransferase
VVEDLISTGKSSLQVCDILKQSGVEIAGMVSIFNYGFNQATNAFEEAGIKLVSLTNYAALVDLAIENETISPALLTTLNNWRENPAEWKGV